MRAASVAGLARTVSKHSTGSSARVEPLHDDRPSDTERTGQVTAFSTNPRTVSMSSRYASAWSSLLIRHFTGVPQDGIRIVDDVKFVKNGIEKVAAMG